MRGSTETPSWGLVSQAETMDFREAGADRSDEQNYSVPKPNRAQARGCAQGWVDSADLLPHVTLLVLHIGVL